MSATPSSCSALLRRALARRGLRAAAVVGTGAVALAALTACSGVDDLPDLPRISSAWSGDGVEISVLGQYNRPQYWRTDDLLVTAANPVREPTTVLTGLDADTGEVAWTQQLPGAICDLSADVDEQGLGAVLLGGAGATRCDRVAVVDTTSGTVVWQEDLPYASVRSFTGTVEVGDRVVTASGGCGEVQRFDTADGSALEPLGTPSTGRNGSCDGPGGIGSDGMVAFNDRVSKARTDLVLVDADDDTEVWRRRTIGVVNAVVSTDPLVLDVTEGSHRLLRTYDDQGRPGPTMGFEINVPSQSFTVLAATDGVVVGTYSEFDSIYAYDSATGELLWKHHDDRFAPDRRLVGVQGDELVWVQGTDAPEGASQRPDRQIWVTRTDARDPDRGRTVGAVIDGTYLTTSDLWLATDDLLVNPAHNELNAYRIDGDGEDGVREVPAAYLTRITAVDWADEDVRTEDVGDACTQVSSETLRLIGLRTDLPAPLLCSWRESANPGGVERTLRVAVEAFAPDSTDTGAERAHAGVAMDRDRLAAEGAAERAVPGLGDEAYVSTRALGPTSDAPFDAPLGTQATVVVRQGNAVVTVSAEVQARRGRVSRSVSPDAVEDGASSAVRDVLDVLDRPLDPAPPGAAGSIPRVPDACALLRSDATTLVPRTKPIDLTVRGSRTAGGCAFLRPYERELVVTTWAAPPGPTGTDAVDVARASLAAAPGDPIDGVGDEATATTTSSPYGPTFATIVARRDNLVVRVTFADRRDNLSPPGERTLRQLDKVARQVLDGSTGEG